MYETTSPSVTNSFPMRTLWLEKSSFSMRKPPVLCKPISPPKLTILLNESSTCWMGQFRGQPRFPTKALPRSRQFPSGEILCRPSTYSTLWIGIPKIFSDTKSFGAASLPLPRFPGVLRLTHVPVVAFRLVTPLLSHNFHGTPLWTNWNQPILLGPRKPYREKWTWMPHVTP